VCGEKILPRYLFYWLIANKPQIKSCIKTGGTVQSIDSKRFSSLQVSYSDMGTQKVLVDQADLLSNLVNIKRENGLVLKELFESVLNKAMKGELI
ncbi:MAG: hypothetical protein Q8L01_02130, partial [Candidatus Woesebacteria bacterium]|nr:hypothetical protein [Candidatus Woesebacteria bacterium]